MGTGFGRTNAEGNACFSLGGIVDAEKVNFQLCSPVCAFAGWYLEGYMAYKTLHQKARVV